MLTDRSELLGKLRCLATLLQQLNAQTAAAAVMEAVHQLDAPPPPAEQASGEIQRWRATGDYAFPAEEADDGEFVAYDDHVAAIAALSQRPVVGDEHAIVPLSMLYGITGSFGRARARHVAALKSLLAALAPQQQGECKHEWVDARNRYVQSGEVCLKCHAMRAGNTAAPQQPTGEEG